MMKSNVDAPEAAASVAAPIARGVLATTALPPPPSLRRTLRALRRIHSLLRSRVVVPLQPTDRPTATTSLPLAGTIGRRSASAIFGT